MKDRSAQVIEGTPAPSSGDGGPAVTALSLLLFVTLTLIDDQFLDYH